VHRTLRRLAILLSLAIPVSFLGRAGATWGAAPPIPVPARAPHGFDASPPADERDAEERAESAVVLVVLDGVRWQEVFGGADRSLARERGLSTAAWASPRLLMPNLQRLLDTQAVALGAPGHGAEVTATGPQFISMPGYLEIFSGHPDPTCESNDCPRGAARTIVDDVREASGEDDIAVISSWPAIARAASAEPSGFALSAGRKIVGRPEALRADDAIAALLDRGAHAKSFPGEGDYRPDAFTSRIALRYLVDARPRFLFVGLGDADEYGHRNDYHGYLEAVHASDAFLGDLFSTLETMGARGRHTTVLVTADHGRAYSFRDHGGRYPESGRVWLVAGGGDMRGRGLVSGTHRHTLAEIAPTLRALLGMSQVPGSAQPIREILSLGTRSAP
jgi:hypothetical protein